MLNPRAPEFKPNKAVSAAVTEALPYRCSCHDDSAARLKAEQTRAEEVRVTLSEITQKLSDIDKRFTSTVTTLQTKFVALDLSLRRTQDSVGYSPSFGLKPTLASNAQIRRDVLRVENKIDNIYKRLQEAQRLNVFGQSPVGAERVAAAAAEQLQQYEPTVLPVFHQPTYSWHHML